MRVFVVDDEQPTLDLMVRSLSEFPDVDVAGAFALPSVALQAVDAAGPCAFDAAFLDISLPGMNGIELAIQLQEYQPELRVVFVTAHDQYALQAFDADAIDYVLKPVSEARLKRSIDRLRRLLDEIPPASDKSAVSSTPLDGRLQNLASPECPAKIRISLPKKGSLAVYNRQGQRVRFSTAKQEDLLRELFVSKGDLRKWELVDQYWPELDAKRAEQNLYMTIYRLKQAIRENDLPFRLMTDKGRYRLELTEAVTIES